MEAQCEDAMSLKPRVVTTLRLGSETYSVHATNKGNLSEQLASMKEQSMSILKDFITKHNVPTEVPDELDEGSSEDAEDVPERPQEKSKKTKIT